MQGSIEFSKCDPGKDLSKSTTLTLKLQFRSVIVKWTMWSPTYEICMVPYGLPFLGASVDDWLALGKSSELRLVDDGDLAININLGDWSNSACSRSSLKYVKVGMEHGMGRYSHDASVHDDFVLRKIPLQNAAVKVKVVHFPFENIRKLECRLDGYGDIHASTHPANERLRVFCLRDIIRTALRSRERISCNTKIVLIRAGSNATMTLNALVWTPMDFKRSRAKAKSLPEAMSHHSDAYKVQKIQLR